MSKCLCGHEENAHVEFSSAGANGFYGCLECSYGTCDFFVADPKTTSDSSPSETELAAYSDGDILRGYDNALADFHLAQRYDHNAHLRNPIQHWIDQLDAELKRRGIEYSHAKARSANV